MANAQKPTSRTRHMETGHFALCNWVERDLVVLLERVDTSKNLADLLTKQLSRTAFYRHADYIMGWLIPPHSFFKSPQVHSHKLVQECVEQHFGKLPRDS